MIQHRDHRQPPTGWKIGSKIFKKLQEQIKLESNHNKSKSLPEQLFFHLKNVKL